MRRARNAAAAIALLTVCGCSTIFPNTERAIQPKDATLDELGIGIVADIEHWVESALFVLNLIGL